MPEKMVNFTIEADAVAREQTQMKNKLLFGLSRMQMRIEAQDHLSSERRDVLCSYAEMLKPCVNGKCGDGVALSIGLTNTGKMLLEHILSDEEWSLRLGNEFKQLSQKMDNVVQAVTAVPPKSKLDSVFDFVVRVKGLLITAMVCVTVLLMVAFFAPHSKDILPVVMDKIPGVQSP